MIQYTVKNVFLSFFIIVSNHSVSSLSCSSFVKINLCTQLSGKLHEINIHLTSSVQKCVLWVVAIQQMLGDKQQ